MLLAAIGASAWNIVGGYAGQVSVGHAVFFGFGAYSLGRGLYPSRLAADRRRAARHAADVAVAAVIGVPTLRLSGHYFSMATIAVAELVRVLTSTSDFLGGAQGLGGPAMPRTVFDLSFIFPAPYLLSLPRGAGVPAGAHLVDGAQPHGLLPAAIKAGERAARSLGVSVPAQALCATC